MNARQWFEHYLSQGITKDTAYRLARDIHNVPDEKLKAWDADADEILARIKPDTDAPPPGIEDWPFEVIRQYVDEETLGGVKRLRKRWTKEFKERICAAARSYGGPFMSGAYVVGRDTGLNPKTILSWDQQLRGVRK